MFKENLPEKGPLFRDFYIYTYSSKIYNILTNEQITLKDDSAKGA